MKKIIPVLLLIFSCLSSNDTFLINNLEDKKKSELITEKGIEKYKEEIEQKENYADTDQIKQYFIIALSYDKTNNTAEDYINKIDSFKKYLLNKFYKNALYYNDKKNKKIIDEYYMCYYLEKALDVDSSNTEALLLKKEIFAVYEKVIKFYINNGIEIKDKINNSKNSEEKNKLFIDAYNNYIKILLINKSNAVAVKELNYFELQISKIVSANIKYLINQIKLGKFDEVYAALKKLEQNNERIKNKFSREILDMKYQLFYNWGLSLYKRNKYQLSLYKINSALAIKKDKDLINLKKKISEIINTEYFKNSYESLIDEIEEYIDVGKLDIAKYKIDSVKKSAKTESQIMDLDNLLKKIMEKIPKFYDEAVNDYNDENFSMAIKKFKLVNNIYYDYKEVKNYLEKAIEKQKVLDNY